MIDETEKTEQELPESDEQKIAFLMGIYKLETSDLSVVDEVFKERLLDVDKLVRLIMSDKDLEADAKNYKATLTDLETDLDLSGKQKLSKIEELAGFAQSFLKISDKIFSQKRQRLLKKYLKLGDKIDLEEEILRIMEEKLGHKGLVFIDQEEEKNEPEPES